MRQRKKGGKPLLLSSIQILLLVSIFNEIQLKNLAHWKKLKINHLYKIYTCKSYNLENKLRFTLLEFHAKNLKNQNVLGF